MSTAWKGEPGTTYERPFQAADVYNATRNKALYEWVSGLEAELARLREENEKLDMEAEALAQDAANLERERDTLEAALREIERGTYPGTALTPGGPQYQTKKRMDRGMMRRVARTAISEVEDSTKGGPSAQGR